MTLPSRYSWKKLSIATRVALGCVQTKTSGGDGRTIPRIIQATSASSIHRTQIIVRLIDPWSRIYAHQRSPSVKPPNLRC